MAVYQAFKRRGCQLPSCWQTVLASIPSAFSDVPIVAVAFSLSEEPYPRALRG